MSRELKSIYRVTPAHPSDLDQIMEIERRSFNSPWARQVFVEEFDHEFSRLMVIRQEKNGRILAFINYWLVQDEVHILNVATHPEWRRKGLARRLLEYAIQNSFTRGGRLVSLEVRRSNHAARRLYEAFGFSPIGVRPRYYENNEDAIVMILDL